MDRLRNVKERRAHAGKLFAGVAAASTSEMFKNKSLPLIKPKARDWTNHLSTEALSRPPCTLKQAARYLSTPGLLSLGGGLPSSEHFPFSKLSFQALNVSQSTGSPNEHTVTIGKNDIVDGISEYDIATAFNYSQATGSPQMMRFVTEHTEIVYDPPYADWQVCQTVGSTGALEQTIRLLCDRSRGDSILTEEYTFATALETFAPQGIKAVGVPMDEEGLLPWAMDDILANWDESSRKPHVLYTVPSGQNPTGATMSLERRRSVYEVCRKHNIFIIEDEPYYFIQMPSYTCGSTTDDKAEEVDSFMNNLIPSFLSLDVDGRVLRMDSFSKVLVPGSRLGWVTASAQIVELYIRHAEVANQGPSGISQLLLWKLLDETWGHEGYLQWLSQLRDNYTQRRNRLLRACEEFLPREVVTWTPPKAGMFNEDQFLLDYFVRSTVPPILASVETQQQWSSVRRHLLAMARESSMVRSALLSFSDLLLRRRRQHIHTTNGGQRHHQDSTRELSENTASTEVSQTRREHLLATCFFLSYVDILEGRTEAAHGSLKVAYHIFDKSEKTSFGPLEIRILSWIRLLDGRAVSAGGEGLFLSDDEASEMLVQPSPAGLDSLPGDVGPSNDADQSAEIEDTLFQALYQPGAIFFQKVQSFMGRISKIDPWHRSRGTVADETEVMIIAAKITRDLDKLFDSRPRLMAYAAKGQLTAQHMSPHLSHTITRVFRTYASNFYASNFYASKVHLHRVAYKTLPLAMETVLALAKIKALAKMMVDTPPESGIEGGEPLPVNMLWPLLMLGSEEEDPHERTWIRNQICRMQEVATNAEMTAQVLDEVQKMQDLTKTRVDIRSIMHKIFDACFAIV
ncbi:putative aromatic aminotransferase Aro8, partial [Aureobasidium melanogenum]